MSLFRPAIDRIEGYAPGEQPQEAGWIKLNTNENPYPPSPRVVEAIRAAAQGRLNLYPDPLATKFRKAAAPLFGVEPDWLLPARIMRLVKRIHRHLIDSTAAQRGRLLRHLERR